LNTHKPESFYGYGQPDPRVGYVDYPQA